MKNILIVTLLFLFQDSFANSPKPLPHSCFKISSFIQFDDCDACGCSANGGSLGFSSMINSNFIGVRYFHQSYKSRDGVFNNSPWIDENFNTMQIWSRIPISKKIEINALIPYQFHNRKSNTENSNVSGLGDINVMVFYKLFQSKNDSIQLFKHRILVGGGIKAPTGTYDSSNNGSFNPSFQLGTGSWDYSLSSEYIVSKNKFGLNTAVNYILKTQNDKNYKFGNQLNYGTTLFYTTEIQNLMIVPQIGIAGENYNANEDFNEKVPFTEGDILFSKIGIEVGFKKFSAGLNTMIPIRQNLNAGRVEANYRFAINLNYGL